MVRLLTQHETKLLPPQSIEQEFWVELVRMLWIHDSSSSHQWCMDEWPTLCVDTSPSLYVVYGPGSFTTLRVGCFLLNQLNIVTNNRYPLYGIHKIDLYYAAYRAGIIWAEGYVYIGQARNVWHIAFDTLSWLSVAACDQLSPHKISINTLTQLANDQPEKFVQQRQEKTNTHRLWSWWSHTSPLWTHNLPGHGPLISYGYAHDGIMVTNETTQAHFVYRPPSPAVYHLEPWYGIDPTIG
jgi:hypothetical protein